MAWVSKNAFLSTSEMQNNADIIYSTLINKGWTKNAIAGMLGNMQSESTINPGIWQNLDSGNMSLGYGLVQWTPASKYINWANDNGYDIKDGYAQLIWIDEVTASYGQWIPTSTYNFSWAEFKTSLQSPEYLASAFLKNFERAGVEVEANRRSQARTWWDYIGGTVIDPSEPEDPSEPGGTTTKKKKGYNFILFNSRRKQQWKHRKF